MMKGNRIYIPEVAGIWALLYFGRHKEGDTAKREKVINHIASILSEHQEVSEEIVEGLKKKIFSSFFAGDVFMPECSLVHDDLQEVFTQISFMLKRCSVLRLIDVNDLEETLEIDGGGLTLLYRQSANQLPC